MAAIVLSIGLVGNLLATTPLAWGTELIGWRGVFAIVVAFAAIATLAVWLVVRDAPPGHPFLERKAESPAEMLRGLGEVLRNPQLPFILTLSFCNYACTFTVQGLWGGPFLREVHGLSRIESGNVLLGAVIAYQVGILVFGPLDRVLDTRKWIAFGGTSMIAMILGMLALWGQPPLWFAIAAIVGMGFVSASSTMIMTHGRGIFPDRLIGRGMATMNTSVMLGVACMQTLVLIVAVAIYSRSLDVKPSDEMRAARQ